MATNNFNRSSRPEIIKEEVIKEPQINLNQYLANFFQYNRNLDKVVVKWFMKKDIRNPKKTRSEWDIIVESFINETE